MTDVTVADKDQFCGGRGKGLVPFRTFDAAFRARCVNRDLSHVLDDTDPNYRPPVSVAPRRAFRTAHVDTG